MNWTDLTAPLAPGRPRRISRFDRSLPNGGASHYFKFIRLIECHPYLTARAPMTLYAGSSSVKLQYLTTSSNTLARSITSIYWCSVNGHWLSGHSSGIGPISDTASFPTRSALSALAVERYELKTAGKLTDLLVITICARQEGPSLFELEVDAFDLYKWRNISSTLKLSSSIFESLKFTTMLLERGLRLQWENTALSSKIHMKAPSTNYSVLWTLYSTL